MSDNPQIPVQPKSFGTICAIKNGDFSLPIKAVCECYSKAGIEDDYACKERISKRAFLQALKEGFQGDEGIMIRPMRKGRDYIFGVVKEVSDLENRDIQYDLQNVVSFSPKSQIIEGKNSFRMEPIIESYKEKMLELGRPEFTITVNNVLYVSMAIKVMCNKCYFIPHKFKVNATKIKILVEELKKIGAPVDIEQVAVENNSETRDNIVRQFSSQMCTALASRIKFCIDVRRQVETGETSYIRYNRLVKLFEEYKALENKIRTYILLLDMTPEEDSKIVENLGELSNQIETNWNFCKRTTSRVTKKRMKFPFV